ncbi:hypothetical protein ACSYTR_02390 [Staphylococcus warneri]|uniref:hypothetical protein n=1 Tax=Staphylococcus warneri TaxID=1292 RepID=UPI001F210929|nr:hypothetical protein [Staphylococcus warneri]MCF7595781.1 hypothetical protein [Staphylococcus warneri]
MTSFVLRPIFPWESEKLCIGHRTRIVSKEELLITNLFKQSNSYKQQRNELIKDIAQLRERNAELEKKAQAFDEIALTVLSEDNDVIKNMNNTVTKIVINNLEREER